MLNEIQTTRHTLDEQQVKELYDNYKKRFIPEIKKIQSEIVTPDGSVLARDEYLPTEYSLIPIDKLKNYIAFLDILQKKNPESDISGIAISFGAYNLDKVVKNDKSEGSELKDPLRGIGGDYRGRLTTYFTPTYYDKNVISEFDADKHIPFYIDYDDEIDKYTGTYKSLFCHLDPSRCPEENIKKRQEASLVKPLSFFTTQDTEGNVEIVSFNEFTDMPPKKSGNN